MHEEPRDELDPEPEARERSRERKERILHTRISEQLAEDIRAIADDLRVPVSNLVRNVLEEAFSAVERVTGDVGHLLDEVLEEAELASERYRRYRGRARERAKARDAALTRARAQEAERGGVTEKSSAWSGPRGTGAAPAAQDPRLAQVVAWQPVVLAAPRPCARTGRELRAGERAYLGLGDAGPLGVYVAADALDTPTA